MKPVRCIDPVMKCCQYCEYGCVDYPDIDTEYFDTSCMYGLERCEPTEEELKEFEDWCNKTQTVSKMDNKDMFKTEYLATFNPKKSYEELHAEYDRLYKLEDDIMRATGYTLKHIRDLFCAGWTLKRPSRYRFF